MKRVMFLSACVVASGLALNSFGQSGSAPGKDTKAMDMGMCQEMMGKDHMGMKGMDMPKECMEMMEKRGMNMKGMAGDELAQGKAHKGVGIVKKVDATEGNVTLQHEPIQSIGWPTMTMTFGVKNKKMLGSLKPDQKVEFSFIQQGSNYVITSIK